MAAIDVVSEKVSARDAILYDANKKCLDVIVSEVTSVVYLPVIPYFMSQLNTHKA